MSTSHSGTLPLLAPPSGAPIDEAVAGRPESSIPEPPVARVVPRSHSIHGETRMDEYAWLRNRQDPEVLETSPGPGCAVTQALTQPVDVVVVAAADVRTWSFSDRGQVNGCQ